MTRHIAITNLIGFLFKPITLPTWYKRRKYLGSLEMEISDSFVMRESSTHPRPNISTSIDLITALAFFLSQSFVLFHFVHFC
ncbi:hypothetical protein V8F20_007517 [Naviculisporaceae sp. PSN 640]